MLRATQPTTIQSAILRAGILTDEAVSCGTLTKGNEKRKVKLNLAHRSSGEESVGLIEGNSETQGITDEPIKTMIFHYTRVREVFLLDLSAISAQQQVEFRIVFVLGATHGCEVSMVDLDALRDARIVAQLQELQDNGFYMT
ncbi:hypothetical protein Tco_0449801 [Tanacetum coccineum]